MILYPIDDLSIPEISIYNERAETRLYHYYEPQPGLFIAETPMVIRRALDAGHEPVSMLGEESIIEKQQDLLADMPSDLPLYVGSDAVLSEIAGYKLARGLLCAMRRKPLAAVNEVLSGVSRAVILDRVMNPTNVGAIFRSAAAFGMGCVILTKGCADPLYRRAARVSMGNVFLIPWTFADERISTPELIGMLRERGYTTIAMALSDDSVPLGSRDFSKEPKLAIVMGSESEGIAQETIESCDMTVRIPMQNGVDSLNVAAASAVAFWDMRNV